MSTETKISRRTAVAGAGMSLIAGLGGKASVAFAQTSRTGPWATGGTARLTASAVSDPFAGGAEAMCRLACQQTLGPCWAPKAPTRRDISEGEPGIPMRMALQLVDTDLCFPMAGAEVEVWHSNLDGAYSAEDVEGGAFCTNDNQDALSGYFFRGRAIADANGRIDFDGCFPGWYGGRAIHIHVLVRPGANAGEEHTRNTSAITQLYFPDELIEEVFAEVAGYRDLGQPDTSNSDDFILQGTGDVPGHTFNVEQTAKGAMLAWKTIGISTTESCGSPGFGGRGGRRRFEGRPRGGAQR